MDLMIEMGHCNQKVRIVKRQNELEASTSHDAMMP